MPEKGEGERESIASREKRGGRLLILTESVLEMKIVVFSPLDNQ